MWVWEPRPPELPWCCGTRLLVCRHSVPSVFQFLHVLQQLEGTAQLKFQAHCQGLLLLLAAVTDIAFTPLILFFWQLLPMTSLKGNPSENCLFHFLLPLFSSQRFQHQLEVIISSVNLQITPTLLPQSLSFYDCPMPHSSEHWPHRPFPVQDAKPTTKDHDLSKELFSFKYSLS